MLFSIADNFSFLGIFRFAVFSSAGQYLTNYHMYQISEWSRNGNFYIHLGSNMLWY